jgi:hypothetical protein
VKIKPRLNKNEDFLMFPMIQTVDQRLQTTDSKGKNGNRFQKDKGLEFSI